MLSYKMELNNNMSWLLWVFIQYTVIAVNSSSFDYFVYTQNPMMQSLDEVPTGEATDCTSIVGSPFCPLQDESSNVVDSDSRLHLLVR